MHGLIAQSELRVYHEFTRLQSMTQWWHWLLLLVICASVAVYVALLYRRDAEELPRGVRWLLVVLRVTAFAGILFFFLDLEKRSERQLIKNSRALVLVDTSLSMGIQDSETPSAAGPGRRVDAVMEEFAKGDFLARLRREHDVVVYRFDQADVPVQITSYPKTEQRKEDGEGQRNRELREAADLNAARKTAAVAAAILLVSCILAVLHVAVGRRRASEEGAWALLASVLGFISAVVVFAVAQLRYPNVELSAIVGLNRGSRAASGAGPGEAGIRPTPAPLDWQEQLAPRGSETRLGDALRYLVDRERGGPLAGIVVLSDGGSNAGSDSTEAIAAATDAGVPLFAVGLGSATRPTNISLVDMEAPPRVYPGDNFPLTGYLQSYGFAGRMINVQLVYSRAAEKDKAADEEIEEERQVKLAQDGELLSLKFDVAPRAVGRATYRLRVVAPQQDREQRDNERAANVEVVERKNHILLFAGGPSREFQFLRNLLFRDRDSVVDVCLQTGVPGISQEANKLLFEFPRAAAELFDYDAMVAFDPDWRKLDGDQVQLLERWVAEKAGGLIVVAGPVHAPQWSGQTRGDVRIETIKALYPVVFYGRSSATLSGGRFASESVWRLQFTPDGENASFLWLEDDALLSAQAWASFDGVYGYFAVKDPKPGARVYARFSDPNTAIDGQLPIYLASQFYGSGRVFFQASGEMWRIRAVSDAYFDRYYTKLVRWVSQGRLLRDSARGVLLLDKERCLLGDQVSVRAILTDAQFLPLTADEVAATLIAPGGQRSRLLLRRTQGAVREGMYLAQFTAMLEGDYRVELQPPHASEGELLVQELRARLPALETERPERNDALLKDLAEKTGGAYYIGLDAALNRGSAGRAPVFSLLAPQDQTTFLPGTPDKTFERLLMTWLLGLVCGALCLEWLTRRLARLA